MPTGTIVVKVGTMLVPAVPLFNARVSSFEQKTIWTLNLAGSHLMPPKAS